ncbi:hypothetical protein GYMLUDRAFT_250863 [Collybiopsis luxurians FD-317 M1]|uniref:Unplaced genomic scaffold GYMLUscaffold_88, whole genome shotgun sequence n=1 Tax=Collybiopsis luxurians FD-317 M1 TaxID=944289 RepID=A0A0D0BTI6_9AGAR|nr:hypothetical protein GYMLUDRAFT_250863 [Collybiopsis luxurians FD-317 M1]
MATYTLQVTIDTSQLPDLKKSGYHLCLARKVGDTYNVIWKGDKQFLMSNEFQWTQRYRVFASKAFEEGTLVRAASNEEDIEYKQECLFDEYGVMQSARDDPEGKEGTFDIVNKYGIINFAVSAEVNGEYSVIYNTPDAIKGNVALTPINQVRVWFGLKAETGTMFVDISGEYIDVKYGDKYTKEILYDADGNWRLLG